MFPSPPTKPMAANSRSHNPVFKTLTMFATSDELSLMNPEWESQQAGRFWTCVAVMVASPNCENLAAQRQTHDPWDTSEGTLSTESARNPQPCSTPGGENQLVSEGGLEPPRPLVGH